MSDTFEVRDDIIRSEGLSEPLLLARAGICEVSVHRQELSNEDWGTSPGTLYTVQARADSTSVGPIAGDWDAIQAADLGVVCGAMPPGAISVDANSQEIHC